MSNRAWMPLGIDDYLADTGHLTPAEHGAYMMLIMHYWKHDGLPKEERLIARITRLTPEQWAESRDVLAEFFGEGWAHKRIDAELAKADAIIEKRKAAANARHHPTKSTAHAGAHAEHMQSKSTDTGVPPLTDNHQKEEPNGSSKKNGSRLPPDFSLPADWYDWALKRGLPAERIPIEFEKLTNWAANAPASKAVKRDWFKAWQNWVISAIDALPRSRGSPARGNPQLTVLDSLIGDMTNARPDQDSRTTQAPPLRLSSGGQY